jgi:hypothetical protein
VDGYALCEILRRGRTTVDIPILVITTESRLAQVERVRQAGADVVLIKPTTPEQMLAETRRLFNDAKQMREHAAAARATAAVHRDYAQGQRKRLSRDFDRFTTTTPPRTPPLLVCPSCDQPLTYEHSHVGGVSDKHAEQWDLYACPLSCGAFQYRHRTRRLRRLE